MKLDSETSSDSSHFVVVVLVVAREDLADGPVRVPGAHPGGWEERRRNGAMPSHKQRSALMAQPLESVRLQKPAWVFFDGAVRPWEEGFDVERSGSPRPQRVRGTQGRPAAERALRRRPHASPLRAALPLGPHPADPGRRHVRRVRGRVRPARPPAGDPGAGHVDPGHAVRRRGTLGSGTRVGPGADRIPPGEASARADGRRSQHVAAQLGPVAAGPGEDEHELPGREARSHRGQGQGRPRT